MTFRVFLKTRGVPCPIKTTPHSLPVLTITMANSNPDREPLPLKDLLYILNHVFLPPELPQEDDTATECDVALCHWVYQASLEFTGFLSQPQKLRWPIVRKMLKTLLKTTQALNKDELTKSILLLEDGGQSCQGLQCCV